MLLIPCPYCGPRAQIEFRWSDQAQVARPDPAAASDQDWADYLHVRDNLRGPAAERWRHTFGCRQWFNLLRDTRTHAILAAWPIGAAPPAAVEVPAAGDERA